MQAWVKHAYERHREWLMDSSCSNLLIPIPKVPRSKHIKSHARQNDIEESARISWITRLRRCTVFMCIRTSGRPAGTTTAKRWQATRIFSHFRSSMISTAWRYQVFGHEIGLGNSKGTSAYFSIKSCNPEVSKKSGWIQIKKSLDLAEAAPISLQRIWKGQGKDTLLCLCQFSPFLPEQSLPDERRVSMLMQGKNWP